VANLQVNAQAERPYTFFSNVLKLRQGGIFPELVFIDVALGENIDFDFLLPTATNALHPRAKDHKPRLLQNRRTP